MSILSCTNNLLYIRDQFTLIFKLKELNLIYSDNTCLQHVILKVGTNVINFTMIVGTSIPNEQPLMKILNSELYMYPAATLPLNKFGDYPNIISK